MDRGRSTLAAGADPVCYRGHFGAAVLPMNLAQQLHCRHLPSRPAKIWAPSWCAKVRSIQPRLRRSGD